MHEDVDDVIAMRSAAPGGLSRMVSASVAVHVLCFVALVLMPRDWFAIAEQPRLMTISLAGSPGERTTGITAAGGRQVDEVAPQPKRPELAKPPEPARPDAMKIQEKTPVKPETTKPTPPAQAPTRTPTTGKEVTKGSTPADTGATGVSPGLTTGGGVGGAAAQLEVADFCCPEFIEAMLRQIREGWNHTTPGRGTTVMRFVILRDGTVTDVQVLQSSGQPLLDLASRSAIPAKLRLGLPSAYPERTLAVRLAFPYER